MGKNRQGGLSVLLGCLVALALLPSVAAESAWPDAIGSNIPPPTAGADLPHFGFPLQPAFGSAAAPPVSGGEGGYPFIGSNPTVPLPTGMTDTSTVMPMPDTGAAPTKVVGHAASVRVQITIIGLALFVSSLFFLSSTSCY